MVRSLYFGTFLHRRCDAPLNFFHRVRYAEHQVNSWESGIYSLF